MGLRPGGGRGEQFGEIWDGGLQNRGCVDFGGLQTEFQKFAPTSPPLHRSVRVLLGTYAALHMLHQSYLCSLGRPKPINWSLICAFTA